MEFTNLRAGATARIVWEFDSGRFGMETIYKNRLKVSDGNIVQYYPGQKYGDNTVEFKLGSDSKTLIIEHDGEGKDAIAVKSVILM